MIRPNYGRNAWRNRFFVWNKRRPPRRLRRNHSKRCRIELLRLQKAGHLITHTRYWGGQSKFYCSRCGIFFTLKLTEVSLNITLCKGVKEEQ